MKLCITLSALVVLAACGTSGAFSHKAEGVNERGMYVENDFFVEWGPDATIDPSTFFAQ